MWSYWLLVSYAFDIIFESSYASFNQMKKYYQFLMWLSLINISYLITGYSDLFFIMFGLWINVTLCHDDVNIWLYLFAHVKGKMTVFQDYILTHDVTEIRTWSLSLCLGFQWYFFCYDVYGSLPNYSFYTCLMKGGTLLKKKNLFTHACWEGEYIKYIYSS